MKREISFTLSQNGGIVKETEKAYLLGPFTYYTGGTKWLCKGGWFPKNHCEVFFDEEEGEKYVAEFSIAAWLLEKAPREFQSVHGNFNSSWVQVFRDHCE